MPRVMWVAIVVCVAGAVFLFRNQSADVPTGIGENQTVVTAPDVETTLDQSESPRSGDVDINTEAQTLTPEKSADAAATKATKPAVTKTPVTRSTPARTTTRPPAESITPAANGPYVVQIGSFGDIDNAEKESARLDKLGWKTLIRVGNTSDGTIIYRVRIGYFKSRSETESFIRQNGKQMRGAIAVHR